VTVITEKFEAKVSLGMANSRMKNFYDLCDHSEQLDFEDDLVTRAVSATFGRSAPTCRTRPRWP
jgi:hypothetical protein